MSEDKSGTAIVAHTEKPVRASSALAAFIGMDANAMLDTIKAQCFKGDPGRVSDAQLAAFVSIAHEMKVNPLLPGMLYAYPISGGGVVPIMGPDAVYKKLAEHPEVDSWQTTVYPEDVSVAPLYATTSIFRKGREHPLKYTAVMTEWKVDSNPNWKTRPRHMLGLRSLKQAARQIIHGIPFDEDERQIMGAIDVTGTVGPESTTAPEKRAEPKKRSTKGVASLGSNEVIGETVPTPAVETVTINGNAATIVGTVDTEKSNSPATPEAQPANPQSFDEAAKAVEQDIAPRTSFLDNEEATLEVIVESVATLIANIGQTDGTKKATPSVKLTLSGGYAGEAYHFGGATMEGSELKALPMWTQGTRVKAKLMGRLNKAAKKVQVRVVEASPVSPAGDIDVE